ncbi:hypothetical protein N7454_000163 [Penicillium verhagenii]|nr:hypothetical protein N7454_000163 [Penicillium verhagenii]
MDLQTGFSALALTEQGGLGNFHKLPPELRIMIWKELFRAIEELQGPHPDSASKTKESILSVMQCSKQLHAEVGDILFNNLHHEIEIPTASSGPAWYINMSARYLHRIRWPVQNEEALVKHVMSFPHRKTAKAKKHQVNIVSVKMDKIERPQDGEKPNGTALALATNRASAVCRAYRQMPGAKASKMNLRIEDMGGNWFLEFDDTANFKNALLGNMWVYFSKIKE